MPRKKYDDEVLRAKALELRRQGYSYREIAQALGCSVYKVYELLSPIENPRSRLKQVAELASKVDELSKRLDELLAKIDELSREVSEVEAKLFKYEQIDAVINGIEEFKKEKTRIEKELNELSKKFTNLSLDVAKLKRGMSLIELSAYRRVVRKPCKYIDDEGYCTMWYYLKRIEGYDMKPHWDPYEDKIVYYLNVKKHPFICVACPTYSPN